jgi:hypothetical protein
MGPGGATRVILASLAPPATVVELELEAVVVGPPLVVVGPPVVVVGLVETVVEVAGDVVGVDEPEPHPIATTAVIKSVTATPIANIRRDLATGWLLREYVINLFLLARTLSAHMIVQRNYSLNLEEVHPLYIDTVQGLKLGIKRLDRGFVPKDVEKYQPARRAARGIRVVDT